MIQDNLIQGSAEWLDFRKTKITATDAVVIMGKSKWKTKYELYQEKTGEVSNSFCSEKMQRGIDLEPVARETYIIQTGIEVSPEVVVHYELSWLMASLDGIDDSGEYLVEIKCAGPKDHQTAKEGKVPDHYYPQLQHQMFVASVWEMDYFSFDGKDGVIVKVKRDQKYCEEMIEKEKDFYRCIQEKTPPELTEDDYIEICDLEWKRSACIWRDLNYQIKNLESQQEKIKENLVLMSGYKNCRGSGLKLSQVQRKGNIDYSSVPELSNLDLEKYRKPPTASWRITIE